MRKFVVSITVTLCLFISLIGTAFASEKDLKKTLSLKEDVMINETLVKKGEYRVKFDAKSEEVTLARDGEVVFSGKAMIEMRPDKARYNSVSFKSTDKGKLLSGFTFAGDRRVIILADAASSSAGEQ